MMLGRTRELGSKVLAEMGWRANGVKAAVRSGRPEAGGC